MIRHVVLFKFRDGISWDDPRASKAEHASTNHPTYIPEILAWECGRNVTPRAVGYDFALVGTFADEAALNRYMVHPDHMIGVALWRELATWVAADFVVDSHDFPHPHFVRSDVRP